MKTKSVITFSPVVLIAMACQPDRDLDPRLTYIGLYEVLTRTTIQSHVTAKIDTLTSTDVIRVSLGQGHNELTLSLPVNLSLTATLSGSSFLIPAQSVLLTNADGSVTKGQWQHRGSFDSKFMSLMSVLQTEFETQTSVARGSKR